jgi:hypothetical protein
MRAPADSLGPNHSRVKAELAVVETRIVPKVINPRMTRSVGFCARRGILNQLLLFLVVKNLAGLENGYIIDISP